MIMFSIFAILWTLVSLFAIALCYYDDYFTQKRIRKLRQNFYDSKTTQQKGTTHATR